MSILMKLIYGIAKVLLFIVRNKDKSFTVIFKLLHGLVIGIYKGILLCGDLILMSVSREHEYMADVFASSCGYGAALTEVLYQIHTVSVSTPGSIIEQLRSTHPPLTERIRELELLNDRDTVKPKYSTVKSQLAPAVSSVVETRDRKVAFEPKVNVTEQEEKYICGFIKHYREIAEITNELEDMRKKGILGAKNDPDMRISIARDHYKVYEEDLTRYNLIYEKLIELKESFYRNYPRGNYLL